MAGCGLSTFSNSERCGYTAASASLILPSSTSVLHPAVVVGQPLKLAVRSGSARLSPMWARPSSAPSNIAPVSVVPIPSSAGSASPRIGDPVVGLVDRPGEHLRHLPAVGGAVDPLDGVMATANQVPGRRPAHPVRNHEEVRAGEAGILIVLRIRPISECVT